MKSLLLSHSNIEIPNQHLQCWVDWEKQLFQLVCPCTLLMSDLGGLCSQVYRSIHLYWNILIVPRYPHYLMVCIHQVASLILTFVQHTKILVQHCLLKLYQCIHRFPLSEVAILLSSILNIHYIYLSSTLRLRYPFIHFSVAFLIIFSYHYLLSCHEKQVVRHVARHEKQEVRRVARHEKQEARRVAGHEDLFLENYQEAHPEIHLYFHQKIQIKVRQGIHLLESHWGIYRILDQAIPQSPLVVYLQNFSYVPGLFQLQF